MQAFRLALSFMTVLPVGIKGSVDEDMLGKAVKYFPLAGLIIGIILAGIDTLILPKVDKLGSSAVVVVALIVMTRALHIDGLADTFDGLLGGRDKEHSLAIMKDSRVGSFGVVAIVAVVLLKVLMLLSIAQDTRLGAIIIFPVLGRWAAAYMMTTQVYARAGGGLGASFVKGSSTSGLIVSTVLTFMVAVLVLGTAGLAAIAAVALFTLLYIRIVKGKIGGITGDIGGAAIELNELVALFVLALL